VRCAKYNNYYKVILNILPIEKIRGLHILKDDNMTFRRPYKLNEVERVLVEAQTSNLLEVDLVKLSKGEYRNTWTNLTTNYWIIN
jgi:hypothetical protein